MITITVATLFPSACEQWCLVGVLGRAIEKGLVRLQWLNPRDFSADKHYRVDDAPFGGGAGMVMALPPLIRLIRSLNQTEGPVHKILLSPSGVPFDQKKVEQLAKQKHLLLICGRYEGIDARLLDFVDEEISMGDFILSGGELGALAIIDAVARLQEGTLGNGQSHKDESFSNGLLEYPQYTRPHDFEGLTVPKTLLSGNHQTIELFRRWQSLRKTQKNRPDLLNLATLSTQDRKLLTCLTEEDFLASYQRGIF